MHENGLTLGQPFGETVALIKAPGAAGVGVNKPDRGQNRLAGLHRCTLRLAVS